MTQTPDGQEPPILETAFLVYMNADNHWMATPEVHLAGQLQLQRQAGPDDLYLGVCMVKKDLECFEVATRTAALQRQAAQAAMEQMAQQKAGEARMPGGGIDLSALRPK